MPNTSISIQFASKLLTTLLLIQVLPARFDGHLNKDAKLFKVAPLSCLPARSIAQRIFEQVLPWRRTTPLHAREVFAIPGNFSVAPAEIRASNIFVYCSMIVSFGLHSHVQEMIKFFFNFFHMGAFFCSLSSHVDVKPLRTIFVFGEQEDIPNSVPFSHQVTRELLQIDFPTRGLQVGVHTSFVQEEPRDLKICP